jgi:hypothetical protein
MNKDKNFYKTNSIFDKLDMKIKKEDWEKDLYLGNIYNKDGNKLCDLTENIENTKLYLKNINNKIVKNKENSIRYLESCKVKKNISFADILKKT